MDNYEEYLTKYAGEPNNPLLRKIKEKKDGSVAFRVPVPKDKKTVIITFIFMVFFCIISLYAYQNFLYKYLDDNLGSFLFDIVIGSVCFACAFYCCGLFDSYKIVLKQKLKWLTIEFKDENHLIETIRKNAYGKGYANERYLNTFDIEHEYYRPKPGPIEVPFEEKFWVFTKIDSNNAIEFPEEKIAIYRSPYYNAEVVDKYEIIETRETNLYHDVIRLFLGKKEYTRAQQNPANPINTILLIVVDNMNVFLENLLIRLHLNSILFCVISLREPTRLYIGTDLRKTQDDDYRERIKELVELLDIKDVDEKYINEYFAKNIIK